MRKLAILICTLFFLSACDNKDQAPSADIKIYSNGTIYTGTDESPTAEAVVVDGNLIVFVGGEREARAQFGERAKIVDLGGAYMYPGFTDAHAHLYGIGQRELTLNLENVSSITALAEKVAAVVQTAEPGEVITGRGWIETHWPENRFPTAADIDPVSPENPVILERADGHAVVINTAMMELIGLTSQTEAPFGGDILVDENGQVTGMLIDAADALVAPILEADPGLEVIERYYETAGQVYSAYGWTGIHSMSVDPAHVPTMERLSGEGRLQIRVYNSLDGKNIESQDIFNSGPRTSGNGLIETRALKLYIDGALGSRGALLLEPYSDAETSGLAQMDKAGFMEIAIPALKQGIQINTHAIGDGGNRLLLDWYAEAFALVPPDERAIPEARWRDEHTQIVNPTDITRFYEIGVIPSMQPSHAIGDLYFAPARLGKKRLEGAYAWRLLIDSGANIAGGSDAPVERGDPRIEFYAAVARKSLDGYSNADWHPEEAVNRKEALKMFTIWPAYASFHENDLGTIEVGKLADFTVFSGDIMTIPEQEILTVDVVMTVVDGNIVYRRY